jgi:hypothetical protein
MKNAGIIFLVAVVGIIIAMNIKKRMDDRQNA